MELHCYAPNDQNNAYFLRRIAGSDDLSFGADPDGDGPAVPADPVATQLSGLTKVDELTFTVMLTQPFVNFPAILGYPAFYPLAEQCLADIEACTNTPVGNGPYRVDGAWYGGDAITLVRDEAYQGRDSGKAEKLVFTFGDSSAAYEDLQAGELDVMGIVGLNDVEHAAAALGERFVTRRGDSLYALAVPLYHDDFADARIRQALSLAIDREAIVVDVYRGQCTPAEGFVSPNFVGYRPHVSRYTTFDVARATELLDAAGGWPGGKLQLWAVTDSVGLATVVGEQIKANLGIDYEVMGVPAEEFGERRVNRGFTGPFSAGWLPDYPLLETYLGPLYTTGGSANYGRYSNPEFDAAVERQLGRDDIRLDRQLPGGRGHHRGGPAGHPDLLQPRRGRLR